MGDLIDFTQEILGIKMVILHIFYCEKLVI